VDEQIKAIEDRVGKLKRAARGDKSPADVAGELAALDTKLRRLHERRNRAALYSPDSHWTIGTASATPVTDGRFVYVVFGTFVVACFDIDGNQQWVRYLPHTRERARWGDMLHVGASPILAHGLLIVPLVDLYALDPGTGRTVWHGAPYPHFGTPFAARVGKEEVLVTAGGGIVCAEDGAVLRPDLRENQLTDAVLVGRTIILPSGGALNPKVVAALLPESLDLPQASVHLWDHAIGPTAFWGTPIAIGNRVMGMDSDRGLHVIDAATGAVEEARTSAGRSFSSSPLSVGERVYFTDEDAVTTVVNGVPPFETIAVNRVKPAGASSDQLNASLAFDGTRVFIRTFQFLYCIGADDKPRPASPG
jgi:outer membrane protein assembly factor BamB